MVCSVCDVAEAVWRDRPKDTSRIKSATTGGTPHEYVGNTHTTGSDRLSASTSNSDGFLNRQVSFRPEDIEQGIKAKKRDIALQNAARKPAAPLRADIIEVDLHADELLDTTAGLGPADILNMQIDRFCNVMPVPEKQSIRLTFYAVL